MRDLGSLLIVAGAVLSAVGVIIATLTNDPRGYLHSEYGGWAVGGGFVFMAVGGGMVLGERLFGPRKKAR